MDKLQNTKLIYIICNDFSDIYAVCNILIANVQSSSQ